METMINGTILFVIIRYNNNIIRYNILIEFFFTLFDEKKMENRMVKVKKVKVKVKVKVKTKRKKLKVKIR